MSEYNIQMNKYNALSDDYDQLYPKPMKHASTHAKDGSDPILPSSIGAYSKEETDTLLANKADGGKKSEWVQDGSAFSRNGIDYCRDDTGTVYVSCYNTILAESIPAWTLKQIAMLPEGFRPLRTMATTIRHDGNRCSSINFYSTGQISIQTFDSAASATAITFSISFPTE